MSPTDDTTSFTSFSRADVASSSPEDVVSSSPLGGRGRTSSCSSVETSFHARTLFFPRAHRDAPPCVRSNVQSISPRGDSVRPRGVTATRACVGPYLGAMPSCVTTHEGLVHAAALPVHHQLCAATRLTWRGACTDAGAGAGRQLGSRGGAVGATL